MRKKSASGVLASLRGSPYRTSTIRLFARCGLAGRPFCASCGWFWYRHGARVDHNVLRNIRVFPQLARPGQDLPGWITCVPFCGRTQVEAGAFLLNGADTRCAGKWQSEPFACWRWQEICLW